MGTNSEMGRQNIQEEVFLTSGQSLPPVQMTPHDTAANTLVITPEEKDEEIVNEIYPLRFFL